MNKTLINTFKNTVSETDLIKSYGYGSILITIVAGEVTEVVLQDKHRFEKDYGVKCVPAVIGKKHGFNSGMGAQGKTRI